MAPIDLPEFDRWWSGAVDALATADDASSAGRYAWACFLAEQAVQLAMKGLLHALGADAWGHDLAVLEQRIAALGGADWGGDRDAALRMARHYIPTRYPDAQPGGDVASHYSASDADGALADARGLLGAVRDAVDRLGAM